jgi:hypothetical protein
MNSRKEKLRVSLCSINCIAWSVSIESRGPPYLVGFADDRRTAQQQSLQEIFIGRNSSDPGASHSHVSDRIEMI